MRKLAHQFIVPAWDQGGTLVILYESPKGSQELVKGSSVVIVRTAYSMLSSLVKD